jgi:methionyl-tRNA formyltransferase
MPTRDDAPANPRPAPEHQPQEESSTVPAGASLRVAVLTTSGAGGAYGFLDGLLSSLGHRIVVVLTTPGPPSLRSDGYLDVAAGAGRTVDVIISTDRSRWARMLALFEPDLLICAAFPYRLPDDVIAVAPLGAINAHSSLLPRYRGPNPQGWVFRNGDAETGLTIHRMTSEFDGGPILSQVRVPVTDDDDIDSLGAKLGPLRRGLFVTAIERAARGEQGTPQNEEDASFAPLFEGSWQFVDWSKPARVIHRQVRSLFELPGQAAGAVADVDGRTIRLLRTSLTTEPGAAMTGAPPPGTVLSAGASLMVQCGDGPLQILEWCDA